MPRIPTYSSRAAAPGPIPGLGTELAAPGRALTRLGSAIAGFGEDLAHRAAREAARDALRRTDSETRRDEPQDEPADAPQSEVPGRQEDDPKSAGEDVEAVLDRAHDDARFAVMRADALSEASLDSDPERRPDRALAYFDAAARQLVAQADHPALREHRQALARAHRAVLVQRLAHRRTGRIAAILNGKLSGVLAEYADAVRRDPAMLAAMLKQGTNTIADSARLAGLGAENVAVLTKGWRKQAYVALVEGTIAHNPELALASLESGELDAPLGRETELIARLTRQARNAAALAEAAERQQTRTQRRQLELNRQEHLERIRRTGRGDPHTEALAGGVLDGTERAAFRDEVATAEAHYATRRRYAFMTAEEIEADIATAAPAGRPRDTDERVRDHRIRIAARDAILAERGKDPAGWAMQDGDVAESFAAAEEAAQAAARPGAGLAEAGRADRLFRRAVALRLQVQADMGEAPRLLAEAEREALAEELATLSPTQRLARFADHKRRYGDHYPALAQELAARVDRGAGLLLANVEDGLLAGMLARGLETAGGMPGRTVTTHRPPHPLPKTADGRTDIGALDPARDYRVPDGRGETVARPEGNALVPIAAENAEAVGGLAADPSNGDPVEQLQARIKTAPDMTDEAFRALQLDIAYAPLSASERARLQNAAADVRAGKLDPGYVFSGQRERDRAAEASSTLKSVPRGLIDSAAVALSPEVLSQRLKRNQIRTLGLLIRGLAGGDKASLHEVLRIIHRSPNLTRVDRSFLYRAARDVQLGQLKPEDVPEHLSQADMSWAADAQASLRAFGEETFPIAPEDEENFSVMAGRAVGSTVLLLTARLLTGVPGLVVATASMGSGEAIERAIAEGATDDEQKQAALLGAAVGLTDIAPIERLLKPVRHIPGMEGALYAITRKAVEQGVIEGTQEAAQAFMQNMVAALSHSPGQDLTEGVAENGLVGFLVGTLFGGGAGAVQTARDGAETGLDLDASVAGTPRDQSRRARYYESALHPNFREASRQEAEDRQAGHDAFGLIDPASGKPVIQPINNADRMLAMADENVAPLERQLKELAANLPGIEFAGARAKGPERLDQKLQGGRRPDTIGDYLGGRILVADPAMLDEAVRALARRYENVEVDDFLDSPRDGGYRAIHMHIVLDTGMTAEIQIMPSDILTVYETAHANYVKWRNKTDLTEAEAREREADRAWAQQAYAEAYERWLQRADEKPSSR